MTNNFSLDIGLLGSHAPILPVTAPLEQASSTAINERAPTAPASEADSTFEKESKSVSDDGKSIEFEYENDETESTTIEIYIRSPKSTEPFSIHYTDIIKPALESFLDGLFDTFYMTLLVLCIHVGQSMEDIPYVLVGAEPNSANFPALEQFPSELQSEGFGVVFSRYTTEFLGGRSEAYPWNRQLQESLLSGLSIGYGLKDTATVGIFIRNDAGSCVGLTAGHLIDNESREITQPGLREFETRWSQLQNTSLQLKEVVSKTLSLYDRAQYVVQHGQLQADLQRLQNFKKDSDDQTLKALKAGTVSKFEFKPIKYDSRKCISDWCIFDVEHSRKPVCSCGKGTLLLMESCQKSNGIQL